MCLRPEVSATVMCRAEAVGPVSVDLGRED